MESKVRSWENPYKKRCTEFPGRIFSFEQPEIDRKQLSQLIGSAGSIHCEVGSGSGRHLLGLAARHPEALIFGFEIRFKRSVRTIEKADAAGLRNVFVLRHRAEFLAEFFPERSVDGIYVNFPDPWSKSRWHKHRILGEEFLAIAASLLKTDGFLAVKTDHREYFESYRKILETQPKYRITEVSNDLMNSEFVENNLPTEFERLFVSQGLPIYYVKAMLVG